MGPLRLLRNLRHTTLPSTRKTALPLVITTLCFATSAWAEGLPNLVSTVIRGSSVYSAPQLFPVYSEFLGKPITRESARSIASSVAERYVSDGYSRPAVRLDDRMVEYGVLVLEVVEARVAAVEVTGHPGPYETRLLAMGQRLSNDSALRSANLQSTVRQMRDLSGLTLTASTRRDETLPGAYRLNIDTDYRPVSGTVRLTNRGTDEIGPHFVLGQIKANGMLGGRADFGMMFGSATNYGEYHGLGLMSSARATDVMRIVTSAFRSRSDPSEAPIDGDDRYVRDRMTVTAVRSAQVSGTQRTLTAGLRAEDLEVVRAGDRLRDERLRLIEFGVRWTRRPRQTVQYAVGYDLTRGINGLGSGLHAEDLVQDPRRADFSLLAIDFVRVAQLRGPWSWRLNSLAQYSNQTLPYSERFKIGGDRLGRGFEVAEIAGDRGIGAKAEISRRLDRIPDAAGRLSIYSFYDIGAAWKNDRPGRESATSAGVGLLLSGSKTDGRLEVAKPLTHADVEGRNDMRVFVEFTISW